MKRRSVTYFNRKNVLKRIGLYSFPRRNPLANIRTPNRPSFAMMLEPGAYKPHLDKYIDGAFDIIPAIPIAPLRTELLRLLDHSANTITLALPPDIEYWIPRDTHIFRCLQSKKDRHPVTFEPLDEE